MEDEECGNNWWWDFRNKFIIMDLSSLETIFVQIGFFTTTLT